MTGRAWATARAAAGAAVLGVLVWRLGAEPFVDGLRATDARSLGVAAVVVAGTTLCCAWRWRVVARRVGLELGLPEAVAAYYRSQFLNSVLPGGVLGDVHRGLSHGWASGQVVAALRSVLWERVAGQLVQVLVTLWVLLALPWPGRADLWAGLLVALGVVVVAVAMLAPRDLIVPGVLVTSALAVTGHVVVFLVAARAAGVEAGTTALVPIALLVLLAAGLPVNVAGWGPREGVAVWAFSAAGLGASTGATVAVVYGVLSLAATLPGAVVLLVRRLPQPRARAAGEAREAVTVGG